MFWKKKVVEPQKDNMQALIEGVESSLSAIISNSGDGVHYLEITSPIEPIQFVFGRVGEYTYNYTPLQEFYMLAVLRIAILKSCVITLESFETLDGTNPDADLFTGSSGPNSVYGWRVEGNGIIPLTSKQIFKHFYNYEPDVSPSTQLAAGSDTSGKVHYNDAWPLT